MEGSYIGKVRRHIIENAIPYLTSVIQMTMPIYFDENKTLETIFNYLQSFKQSILRTTSGVTSYPTKKELVKWVMYANKHTTANVISERVIDKALAKAVQDLSDIDKQKLVKAFHFYGGYSKLFQFNSYVFDKIHAKEPLLLEYMMNARNLLR